MGSQAGNPSRSAISSNNRVITLGGGSTSSHHPFKILTRFNGGKYEYGVVFDSCLFDSLTGYATIAIDGLLDEESSTGWYTFNEGYPYITLEVDNPESDTPSAIILDAETALLDPYELELESFICILTRKYIAKLVLEEGQLTVEQYTYTHLRLTDCIDTYELTGPQPALGAYLTKKIVAR